MNEGLLMIDGLLDRLNDNSPSSPLEKFLKQMLDHIFWGCFGVSHVSHVRLISKVSFQPQRWHRGWWNEEKERTGIEDGRIKEELESTGVKQLAEKLAMAADLLKYSPHSEITDVIWGICVSICKLLLSMPFSFSLHLTHSSLLPVHPLLEGIFLLSQREN